MKDRKRQNNNRAVKYQIVQRYFGEDETLSAIHKDKELTYPKTFNSADDAQELIDITLQNYKFEDWDLEVREQYDVDQYLDQDDDNSTFNVQSYEPDENDIASTDPLQQIKREFFD